VTAALASAAIAGVLYTLLARRLPRAPGLVPRRPGRIAARGLALAGRAAWEETLWRWVLLGRLSGLFGAGPALALTSLGFGLSHRRTQGWHGAGVHVLTGGVFGGVYLVSESLLAAVVAHAVYNALVAVAIEAPG